MTLLLFVNLFEMFNTFIRSSGHQINIFILFTIFISIFMIMTCTIMRVYTMMILMTLTLILTETHNKLKLEISISRQINNDPIIITYIQILSSSIQALLILFLWGRMRKITYTPITNRVQFPDIPQISSHRAVYEYLVQLQKWEEIRQKMKSMQLNKIQVTSYINKTNRKANSSCDKQPTVFQNHDQIFQNRYKNSEEVKLPENGSFSPKVFKSRNGARSSLKGKPFSLTPYLATAYKLQLNKVKMSQKTSQNIVNHQKIQNPQVNQQKKIEIKNNSKQLQKKIKKRQKRLAKSKTQSNSSYSKGKILISNVNKANNYSDFNDLAQFSKVDAKDITERVIVRRKSNINSSDGTIQAIQASVLKKKIILFTVDITSGNGNDFLEGIKSPFNLSNQFEIRYPSQPQKQVKIVTHTPTRTHQMKLLLGTGEILQYLQYFGFSHHPLELYNSTQKLAIILVDMLKITTSGLKIDKNQIMSIKNSNEENKKQVLEQACKKLQNSELIRWKNQNHSKRNQHNRFNRNLNKTSETKNIRQNAPNQEIQFYRAYGHPHPVINGKQYQKMASYEHEHPQQVEVNKQSKEISKKQVKIEDKNVNLIDENIQEITIQKTLSQKDSVNKIPQENSQQFIIEQNHQNHKKTLSISEAIPNESYISNQKIKNSEIVEDLG